MKALTTGDHAVEAALGRVVSCLLAINGCWCLIEEELFIELEPSQLELYFLLDAAS